MAEELDDGEFWLPSEFLEDDDLVMNFKTNSKRIDDFSIRFGNSFRFNPHLSSPVESIVSSTEIESDDDEFLTALTQKIAKSTLQESNFYSDDTAKGSCSPKSTLFMNNSGSGWNSPNCVSPVSPPPDTIDAVRFDLMNAAAGEVSRRRLLEETTAFYSNKLCAPTPKLGTNTVPIGKRNSASEFYGFNNQIRTHVSYQQYVQLQQIKQTMMMMSEEAGENRIPVSERNGYNRFINGGWLAYIATFTITTAATWIRNESCLSRRNRGQQSKDWNRSVFASKTWNQPHRISQEFNF